MDKLKVQIKKARLDEKMALRKITSIMVELEELERIMKGSKNDLRIDIREQFNKIDSSLRNIEKASISNTHIATSRWISSWNNRRVK